MIKHYYVACMLTRELAIAGSPLTGKLEDKESGVVGALMVFSSEEAAWKWHGLNVQLQEIILDVPEAAE